MVIAVDPSGCAGEDDRRSDEIGIIAAGIGHDGVGRILEDATGRYSPDEWAHKSLELYDRWKADTIVAETNLEPIGKSIGATANFSCQTTAGH